MYWIQEMRIGWYKNGGGEHSKKTHTHLGNLKHSNKNEQKRVQKTSR